jgi:hypothetical protein
MSKCRGVDVSASLWTTLVHAPSTLHLYDDLLHPQSDSSRPSSCNSEHPNHLLEIPLSLVLPRLSASQTERNPTLHLKETHREKGRRGRSVVRIARSRL